MACTLPAAEMPLALEPPPRPGRAMTRCECAEMPFAEVARRLREERRSFEEVARGTGCGKTCTACLPDLRAYLARG
jgi:bacterioferritin-associated ferredoxin